MGASASVPGAGGGSAPDIPPVSYVPPMPPVPHVQRPTSAAELSVFRAVTPCGSPLFSAYRAAQLYCRRMREPEHVERITVRGDMLLEPAVWVVTYDRETDSGDETRELGMYTSEAAARAAATKRAYVWVHRTRVYDHAEDAPGERIVYGIYNTRFT